MAAPWFAPAEVIQNWLTVAWEEASFLFEEASNLNLVKIAKIDETKMLYIVKFKITVFGAIECGIQV